LRLSPALTDGYRPGSGATGWVKIDSSKSTLRPVMVKADSNTISDLE
jgi:hypothetical protein